MDVSTILTFLLPSMEVSHLVHKATEGLYPFQDQIAETVLNIQMVVLKFQEANPDSHCMESFVQLQDCCILQDSQVNTGIFLVYM